MTAGGNACGQMEAMVFRQLVSRRAAYEKFGEGGDCLAQSRRGRRDGRAACPHAAESGRAALVAAVEVPFDLPDGWAWTRLDDLCPLIR